MRAAAILMSALLLSAAAVGCGGDNTGTGTTAKDMTLVKDMASVCGHPG
ncbi:MAG: hypothetical protein JWN44_3340, partial [Myxococcales bacterium]|nr:hypothetical protein [Myxococcales bacterium]